MLKRAVVLTWLSFAFSNAAIADCSRSGSEAERRSCENKLISEEYVRLAKLAATKANAAEAITENTKQYRKELRDAHKFWEQYAKTLCGSMVTGGGGSAGMDDAIQCHQNHQVSRAKELGE